MLRLILVIITLLCFGIVAFGAVFNINTGKLNVLGLGLLTLAILLLGLE